ERLQASQVFVDASRIVVDEVKFHLAFNGFALPIRYKRLEKDGIPGFVNRFIECDISRMRFWLELCLNPSIYSRWINISGRYQALNVILCVEDRREDMVDGKGPDDFSPCPDKKSVVVSPVDLEE